jgi:hypothetical protein
MPDVTSDPAQVLEDAADLMLVRGRARSVREDEAGGLCVVGAVCAASDGDPYAVVSYAHPALPPIARHLGMDDGKDAFTGFQVAKWNDRTDDDFEVIDTLRHVAKSLRNGDPIGDAGADDATHGGVGR